MSSVFDPVPGMITYPNPNRPVEFAPGLMLQVGLEAGYPARLQDTTVGMYVCMMEEIV
jgi:hypothetical protein